MLSFRRAIKWAYVNQACDQGLNALFTVVLAVMLGPRNFGIIAMALAYILFIKMFLEQGLTAALIQRKELRKDHLDSIFCFNLGLSILCALVSIICSRWWSHVNHLPQLASVISVLSLALPIEGATLVQRALFVREMDFKGLSMRSLLSNGAGGVVGLILALYGMGVWALVAKQLVGDAIGSIALWKLGHWTPKLQFSPKAFKELLGFSVHGLLGNVGLYFNSQADALIIGLFLGPVAIGVYRLAQRITNTLVSIAASSLQMASYPHFCRLQDQPEALRQSVLSCFRIASVASIPALACIAIVARPLLSVFGPQWIGGVHALQILCIAAAMQPILYFAGPLMQALSKPHYLAVVEWAHALFASGALVITGEYFKNSSMSVQVTAVSAAKCVTLALLMLSLLVYISHRLVRIDIAEVGRALRPSLITAGSVLATASVASSSLRFIHASAIVQLVVECICAALLGGAVLVAVDEKVRGEMRELTFKLRLKIDAA